MKRRNPVCNASLFVAACSAWVVLSAMYCAMFCAAWLTANLLPSSRWGRGARRIVAHELEQWKRGKGAW